MGHFILSTQWSDGDVLPFLRIGEKLVRQGHSAVLVTHPVYEESARRAGLDFVSRECKTEYRSMMEDIPGENNILNNYQEVIDFYRKHLNSKNIARELEMIMSVYKPGESVILARSGSSPAALLAAELLNAPIASLVLAPAFISDLKVENTLLGPVILEEVNQVRKDRKLLPVENWFKWVSSPKKILGLWPDWFSRGDEFPGFTIEPVGFPLEMGTQEAGLPAETVNFLKNGDVILITGGTGKFIDPGFFKKCIEGCGKIGRKALIVTKKRELLPEKLPDWVRWVEYVSFAEVFPLAAAIIHHGGIGTLSAAFKAGVPQLIFPEGFDRPDNARRVLELGAGDFIIPQEAGPENIAQKLERITRDETVLKISMYKKYIQQNDTFEKARGILERMINSEKCRLLPAEFTSSSEKRDVKSTMTERKKAILMKLLKRKKKESVQ